MKDREPRSPVREVRKIRIMTIIKKTLLCRAGGCLVVLITALDAGAAELQELTLDCELKENPEACLEAGAAYLHGDRDRGVAPDPGQAAVMFTEACEFGDEEGCADAFALILDAAKKGKADPEEVAGAEDGLNRLCENGDGNACYMLGEYYERDAPERAWKYYDAACALEIEHACL